VNQPSEDHEIDAYERPNKSKQKREVQALLDLVKKLVDMRDEQWVEFALPEAVVDALLDLREMRQHGARKRQVKLVAKLLRGVDVSLALEAVDNKNLKHAEANLAFHQVEQWRDRLLLGNQDDLTEFLRQHPDVEVQHLRHLVRNAKSEQKQGKSPKSMRLLFKSIRDACI